MPVELGIAPPDEPEVETPAGDTGAYDDALEVPAQVDESVVRGLIKASGNTACYLFHDDDVPTQWQFTERELDDLIPPLTRYVNRNASLRAAVMRGDEATMAIVIAGYAGRNYEDGRRAAKVRKERDAIITGETGGTARQAPPQSGGQPVADQPNAPRRGPVPASVARGMAR